MATLSARGRQEVLRLEKKDETEDGLAFGWKTCLVLMSDGNILIGPGKGRYRLLRPKTEAMRAACASPEALKAWGAERGFSEVRSRVAR